MEVNVSFCTFRPSDLAAFLPFACEQLGMPFSVKVLLRTREEYVSNSDDKNKKMKRDKLSTQPQTSTSQEADDRREASAAAAKDDVDEDEVGVTLVRDAAERPVELLFYRCTKLPRSLVKIIGLCIPYNMELAKISIRWRPLDGFVLYEIAKILTSSHIREICLDDSPVAQRNYCLLLEQPSQLRCLSLARCRLRDEDVAAMAANLPHPLPASRTLAALSLEGNRVTDGGARALAEALRTNRSLRHLNLAGNSITNLGADYIFRSLVRFPISNDELISRKRRTFEYLKMKREIYEKFYREPIAPTDSTPESGRSRRKTVVVRPRKASAITLTSIKNDATDALAWRAEIMASELLDSPTEPFGPAQTVTDDDVAYCTGNFTLSHLNLAYNSLGYRSVERLARVVEYQAQRARGAGLLRVVLEGNPLPAECRAARLAADGLERAAAALQAPQVKAGRKSERPKIKAS